MSVNTTGTTILGLVLILISATAIFRHARHFWWAISGLLIGLLILVSGLVIPAFGHRAPQRDLLPAASQPAKQSQSRKKNSEITPKPPAPLLSQSAVAAVNAALANQLTATQAKAKAAASTSEASNKHENDWTLYVTAVTIDRHWRVTGRVDTFKVSALVPSARKTLAAHIQQFVQATLNRRGLATPNQQKIGLFTIIKAGEKTVARSKPNDYRHFTLK